MKVYQNSASPIFHLEIQQVTEIQRQLNDEWY